MKYCNKCGAKLDDKSRFCTSCGAAQPDQAENNDPGPHTPHHLSGSGKHKKLLIKGGVLCLALIMIMVIAGIVRRNSLITIDLTKYAGISFNGYNGYADAEEMFDEEACMVDLIKALVKKGTLKKDYLQYISDNHLTDQAALEYAAYEDMVWQKVLQIYRQAITLGGIDKRSNIANGDVVNMKIIYDNTLAAQMKIKFKGDEVSVKAKDLPDPLTFDAFEHISEQVSFYGYDGYGTAELENTFNAALVYTLDKTENLKNGETLKVSVAPYGKESFDKSYLDEYNMLPKALETEIKVTGLMPVVEYDPFSDVDSRISYRGYDGYGKVELADDPEKHLHYAADRTSGLKNGDEISVKVTPAEEGMEADHGYERTYGVLIYPTEKTVKVTGLEPVVDYDPFTGLDLQVNGWDGYGILQLAETDATRGIRFYADRDKDLKNGDKIKITAEPLDNDLRDFGAAYEEIYGLHMTKQSITYEVKDLPEIETFDPFAGQIMGDIRYTGIAPQAQAAVQQNNAEFGLTYSLNRSSYLKNGDELTVTVSPSGFSAFDSDYAAVYRKVPSRTSFKVKVEGLPKYAGAIEEIPDQALQEMQETAELYWKNQLDGNRNTSKISNVKAATEYVGLYLLKAKSEKAEIQNKAVLVYRETLNADFSDGYNEYQNENLVRYWYGSFRNISVNPDQTYKVNLADMTCTVSFGEEDIASYNISERGQKYNIWGYRTLDGLFSQCIFPETTDYVYERALSEDDGIIDATVQSQFTPEDLTYMSTLAQLPEAKLQKIKETVEVDEAQRTNHVNTEGSYIRNFKVRSEYVGLYLLSSREKEITPRNMLYVVYKEDISAEYYCYNDGNKWPAEEFTRYLYWRYDDVQLLPDGTCLLDPGAFVYIGTESEDGPVEAFTFSEGRGDRSYTYAGYRLLDGLYKNCVAAHLAEYTYETTIAPEEDGTLEGTAGASTDAAESTYMTALEQLPEAKLQKIKETVEADEAQRTNKTNTESSYCRNFTSKAEYVGLYLLNNKKKNMSPQNMLYVVYREDISAEYYCYNDGNKWPAEKFTRYLYWRYDDVQLLPDGTCILDPGAFVYIGTEEDGGANERFTFSEGMGNKNYTYAGYRLLDGLYKNCVASRLAEYTYETTIAPEEDGSQEGTAGMSIDAAEITYMTALKQLPEAKLQKIKETVEADEAQRTNQTNTESSYCRNFTAKAEYVGLYLLSHKKKNMSPQNMLYVVYKEDIRAEYYCYSDGNKWPAEEFTRYLYWRYDDVQLLPDGTCLLDPAAFVYVGTEGEGSAVEAFTFSEGRGNKNYTYVGYRLLDGLYKNCVAARLPEYTYETTISPEEDGSQEGTAGSAIDAAEITYMTALKELPEAKLQKIKKTVEADQAQRTNTSNAESSYCRNFTAKAEYAGLYLLSNKKKHMSPQNMLYVVYKEDISAEYYYYDSGNKWAAETFTRYLYWRYDDVQLLPDGTCLLDPAQFTYVGEGENETFSIREKDKEYTYSGFLSQESFLDTCIVSQQDTFDLESDQE